MNDLTGTFRAEVLAFIATHGFSDRAFSLACGLSENFVLRLRRNVAPRAPTIDRVRDFMDAYKAQNAKQDT